MIRIAQFLYDWQTVIAGALALAAAWLTIRATKRSADLEIEASQAQIAVAQKQIETTVRLEQDRIASEASAFHAMLAAAMDRVLAEATRARKKYPQLMTPQEMLEAMGAGLEAGSSPEALAARKCITKGAFAELRAACVRRGGLLTGDFLELEREIDSFAMQWEDKIVTAGYLVRMGKHAGLDEQLALIETKAAELRKKAVEAFRGPDPKQI